MKAEITRNAMNVFRNETLLKAIDKELTELESKAAKWDDPQTQADLELAAEIKENIGKNIFISVYRMCEVFHDIEHFTNWLREQKRGGK